MSITQEFNSTKGLVSYVLEHYPNTRNSDNALFVECCKKLGARDLDDINNIDLNLITVHKTRQIIQNKEGKFLPTEDVRSVRKDREVKVREYMVTN